MSLHVLYYSFFKLYSLLAVLSITYFLFVHLMYYYLFCEGSIVYNPIFLFGWMMIISWVYTTYIVIQQHYYVVPDREIRRSWVNIYHNCCIYVVLLWSEDSTYVNYIHRWQSWSKQSPKRAVSVLIITDYVYC